MPYTDEDIAMALENYLSQGQLISDYLLDKDVEVAPDSELAAMIAYLQRLGRGPQPIKAADVAAGGR